MQNASAIRSIVAHISPDQEVGGTDPAGIRRMLRHYFGRSIATIALLVFVVAALLGLGNPPLLALICGLVGALLALTVLAQRIGHMSTDRVFRLALFVSPALLALVGLAAWEPQNGEFHGEIVALIGLMAAGLVAIAESTVFAAAWVIVAVAAASVGIAFGGPMTAETAIALTAIPVGFIFGTQARAVLEAFLGERSRLVRRISRVSGSGDPFDTAAALVETLIAETPLRTVSFIWFTNDGKGIFLAIDGPILPPYLATGKALPDERATELRRQAATGPWIAGWTVHEDDEGYSKGIAKAGITAAAYVPLVSEGRLIGLLGAGATNTTGGREVLAEQFPILIEVGDIAGTALGPGLAALERRSMAASVIDDIIRERRYWPVFQPIRDLNTNQFVGYEALTRFANEADPGRMFVQASLAGRLRELEVATLQAAVKESRLLPLRTWLSVNSSADLLLDTGDLGRLLDASDRHVVIELSEHEPIDDYGPIVAAVGRLGEGRSLAVDDVGAGFASLRHILEVRPSFVKLDLGLVQRIAIDASRRALVAGFVHFAREARFSIIAEGIEEGADLAALRALGVPLGQGYLLGRPEKAADLIALEAAAG